MFFIIVLNNITKAYNKKAANEVVVFNNFSLAINSGEMVAIMGRSGSGKSTLLGVISGLIPFDQGEYFYNDKKILKNQKYTGQILTENAISIIVQNYALIDDFTVRDNVLISLRNEISLKKKKIEKVVRILEELEIIDLINKYPSELSGGQCQRVAIARAIVSDPQTILADEPTGALDEKTESQIMDIFTNLNKQGKTIIIATHNPKIAQKCQRTIIL